MATAAEIIDEARDYHPAFKEGVPDKMLVRRLSRAQRELYVLVSTLEPELLAETVVVGEEEIAAALEERRPAGLPAYLSVVSGRVFFRERAQTTDSVPLWLLDTRQRSGRMAAFPSATPVAGGLLLTDLRDVGSRETGWQDVGRLEVRYVPAPAPLANDRSELTAPDELTDALIGDLVSFMARRKNLADPELRTAADQERGRLIDQINTHGQATTWHVEPAWP